jgi:GH35 family endo-1,4-beta-xylanase
MKMMMRSVVLLSMLSFTFLVITCRDDGPPPGGEGDGGADSGADGDSDSDGDADGDTDGDSDSDGDLPDKWVGNITTNGSVRTSDFLKYWDQITPENEGKWGSVEGTRDQMNWRGVEAAYRFAKQNNIPFKQHTFVWGSQYPYWIDSLSPSEQADEIEEWIRLFCERFPDTDMIDVVNEAVSSHAPANYARSAFGNDWVIKSFEMARRHCPNAVLILNDYNVLRAQTDDFINLARPVIESGYVDAIGCQAHGLGGGGAGVQPLGELKANLERIADLGLPVYISEYDIEQTNDDTQLEVMKEQFPVFYEHPSVVGITYWGYVVGSTWRSGTGLVSQSGTPRPALTWLMDYLGR